MKNFLILSILLTVNFITKGQIIELGYIKSTRSTTNYATGTYMQDIIDPDNLHSRGVFSTNTYWDFNENQWKVMQMGANDVTAVHIPNGGGFNFIVHSSTGNFQKNFSHADFLEGSKVSIHRNGNLGVGIMTPINKLDLRLESAYGYTARFAEANGAGIILGVNPNNDDPLSGFIGHTSSNRNIKYAVFGTGNHIFNTGSGQSLTIHNSGKVGIGTTDFSGSHKLRVEGSIGAREIKVEANGWSDFVFDHKYELRTLEEVESYIHRNKHLPEIPSEGEVLENGINLGEMNALLLQKIEELTLYMIDMNKKVNQLEQENFEIKQSNQKLQNEIFNIKNESRDH